MSADRKAPRSLGKPEAKQAIDDMLDFGPDSVTPLTASVGGKTYELPDELGQRILQIVKKLQELNLRVDRLANDL